MTTRDNLQEAFAGESQANRKYLAFAEQAARDNLPQIARLFRAVAEAETIHAHAHLKAMDGVQATAANLEEAMAGEEHEFTHMYPPMVAMAHDEGHKKAERSMTHAMEVEKIHYELFKAALAAVKAGQDLPEGAFHICPVCGHTELGPAPERCPICNASGAKYIKVA